MSVTLLNKDEPCEGSKTPPPRARDPYRLKSAMAIAPTPGVGPINPQLQE